MGDWVNWVWDFQHIFQVKFVSPPAESGNASPGAKVSNKVTLEALGAKWKFIPRTSGRVRRSAGSSWENMSHVRPSGKNFLVSFQINATQPARITSGGVSVAVENDIRSMENSTTNHNRPKSCQANGWCQELLGPKCSLVAHESRHRSHGFSGKGPLQIPKLGRSEKSHRSCCLNLQTGFRKLNFTKVPQCMLRWDNEASACDASNLRQ